MEGTRLVKQKTRAYSTTEHLNDSIIGKWQLSGATLQKLVADSLIGSTLWLRLNLKTWERKTRESIKTKELEVTVDFDDTITQKLRNFSSIDYFKIT